MPDNFREVLVVLLAFLLGGALMWGYYRHQVKRIVPTRPKRTRRGHTNPVPNSFTPDSVRRGSGPGTTNPE